MWKNSKKHIVIKKKYDIIKLYIRNIAKEEKNMKNLESLARVEREREREREL